MNMNKGFTLLELVIVIIIIGVLATLGFTQYTRMVERGRTAEAKAILGTMRTAEQAYNLQYGAYTSDISLLAVQVPTTCATTHYFSYSTSATAATAARCTTSGKTPNGTTYSISVGYASGDWGGTAGYY